MRGDVERRALILSPVTPNYVVLDDHPIREIRPIVGKALSALSPTFGRYFSSQWALSSVLST